MPAHKRLLAYDLHGNEVIVQDNVLPDQLPDYIGKEAAVRLTSQEPQRYGYAQNPVYTLKGENLTVGGEGMKAFYDQLLPARLNKILKPFGGKVEQGKVRSGNAPADVVARYANQPDHPFTQRQSKPAWIARLTPEMKERIRKEGLPLLAILAMLTAEEPREEYRQLLLRELQAR